MNADIIQIKGLKSGAYQLLIDTTIVGLFSNKDFENGINLSKYQTTPQYQQASSILELFDEYWKTERTLRVMKYVEYSHLASVINKEDMEEAAVVGFAKSAGTIPVPTAKPTPAIEFCFKNSRLEYFLFPIFYLFRIKNCSV